VALFFARLKKRNEFRMFSKRYQRIRHLLQLLPQRTYITSVWRVCIIGGSLIFLLWLSMGTVKWVIAYMDNRCPPTCLTADAQAGTTTHVQTSTPPSTAKVGVIVPLVSTTPTNTLLSTSPSPQATATQPAQVNDTATTIVLPTQPTNNCTDADYQAPLTGVHPPIGQSICVPPGHFTWISSDPVTLSIPDINYTTTFAERSSMFLIGPVIFQLTGVDTSKVWMETRADTKKFGITDGATTNIIYHAGTVCPITAFIGTSCP
jgi:hypothetical protein